MLKVIMLIDKYSKKGSFFEFDANQVAFVVPWQHLIRAETHRRSSRCSDPPDFQLNPVNNFALAK